MIDILHSLVQELVLDIISILWVLEEKLTQCKLAHMVPKLPLLERNVDLLVMFHLSTIMVINPTLDNQQKTSSKTLTLNLKMVLFNQHLWVDISQRASLLNQAMVNQDQQMHSKLMWYLIHFHKLNSMQVNRVDILVLDHTLQTIKLSKKTALCIS